MADRFVLTLINNRQVKGADFLHMESGAVLLSDDGRKAFLKNWQGKKQDTLTHPYLGEKLPWGMIPYVQALLLARYRHPRRSSTLCHASSVGVGKLLVNFFHSDIMTQRLKQIRSYLK